ncbi:hypothetical protein SNE40_004324 [Patella caerulea]|uniref:SMP-30/Gluconolactonase/LRE-like region domain-containing protein n=1 Tax=Patella caerulea TaxID=87958 RepID=A0AAN8K937_PATCE
MTAEVQPEFTQLLTGLMGAEGPVFDNDGSMYVVAPEVVNSGEYAGQILKIDLENQTSTVLCSPSVDGYGGIPAGCQVDKEGNIMVADMRLGILKVQPNGAFSQVCVKDNEGLVMQGCNDCSYDYHGNLWVTAPAGSIAPNAYTRSMEEGFGSVYCLTTNGTVKRVATGIRFPNGIAVQHSSDGTPLKIIVAETPTKLLWGFDIHEETNLKNKTQWGKMPGVLEGGADGMDFDEAGNLLVAHWGSGHVEVFGANGGDPIKRIKCPFERPSNIHFKPKSKTVYITEHDNHALWKFDWENRGKAQFCETS